jgi:hypothetical protein
MDFDQNVLEELRRRVTMPGDPHKINTEIFSLMLWYRTKLLENLLFHGRVVDNKIAVMNGPFKDLILQLPCNAGSLLPMVLGCYEHELHPFVAEAIHRNYKHVVNVGCGDGYYTVGMAMRMPQTQFSGYDLNPKAQVGCKAVAALNNVADRVHVGGEFRGEDFTKLPPKDTLVICDIEGGEDELLDPGKFPALKQMDVIVELHEVYKPGVTQRLKDRFATTHNFTLVPHGPKIVKLPIQLQGMSEVDEFLFCHEGRGGPTPWGIIIQK